MKTPSSTDMQCTFVATSPGSRVRRRQCATKGFTLLELMVVMLLITIMFAMTAPRISSNLLQDPQKKTTRWLMNTVRLLRSTAVEKQKSQILVVDVEDNRFYIADEEMDDEARSEAAKKGFALPGSLRLIDVQFPGKGRTGTGAAEIIFYPGGFSEQAAINVENGEERLCYLVAPLLPRIKVVDEWIRY